MNVLCLCWRIADAGNLVGLTTRATYHDDLLWYVQGRHTEARELLLRAKALAERLQVKDEPLGEVMAVGATAAEARQALVLCGGESCIRIVLCECPTPSVLPAWHRLAE